MESLLPAIDDDDDDDENDDDDDAGEMSITSMSKQGSKVKR